MCLTWILVLVAALGCGRSGERGTIIEEPLMPALVDTTVAFPHVRYADGQVSINNRCIVRQIKLSAMMRPIYVNGRPIGFC